MTSPTTIYANPDGHEIAVVDNLLTACTSEGTAVSIPIGPEGLRDVAAKLLAQADADVANTAEHEGAALGLALVQELVAMRGRSQADALRQIHDKLQALNKMGHFDRAAGGFSVAILNVLQVGVANLPRVEGCK
ncbi:hypothetical protein [Extensimonas vulgaris]|jgi:hypothetical protein|uniref:Uncharacterized protein n=1 Tax=Extensimonas vulgaris TaxID=1031594 RepID=A0A369ALH2_9BURK|nr:hypothetical protein [Extensimonas vulgaris]RCX08254.1 hypothetical protein DFR45_10974 [Extensimonas vulgaris]TWI37474.1 hypothetical protein IP95_02030 [Extensimonas vulgaris]TXD13844.1 hypothetical protein FUT63_11360 [Extensimonas vulgaris]